jgi:primosomal protein DnaI
MINAEKVVKDKYNTNKEDLKVELFKAKKDENFKKIVDSLKFNDDYLCKYTSKLKQCAIEMSNCDKCKGLETCKNEVIGCMYTPIVENDNLVFSHNICKYKKNLLDDIDYLKNSYVFTVAKEVRNAKMKDIYTDDKKRLEVLTWMTTFIKEYKKGKAWKGLYLSGNFGSGKSYLLSAMINEIVKSGKKASLVYYPEFLRSLKASFGKDFDEQFNYAKNADLLLLDDIGAENVTSWSRDEVLGPILQYRMDEKLPTFFTSNLSLEELEVHLSESKDKIDKIKAKRIIERIKYITDDIKLISENRRN